MPSRSLTGALRETLALFDAAGPPLTTTEVADRLDLGRRSTYERLERLVDRDELDTKKVGSSGRVWWRPSPAGTIGQSATDGVRPVVSESLVDILDLAEVGVFILDSALDVAWIDATAERYLGLDRTTVVGREKHEIVHEQLRPIVAEPDAFVETVLATDENDADTETFEFRITAGEGREERWIEHRSMPIESGRFAGGRVEVYYDVTDRKERERELEEYRRWNQTLVENVPSGAVALVDEDFRYVTFGGTPVGDADVTRADLEGSPVRDVLPEEIADVVVPRYEAALDGEPSAFEDTVDDRIYQFHFVPVRDDDGDVFAATAMSRDITDRKEREQELRDAKLQLEAATEAGAVGTWEWQIPEDRFVAGPSFARTFGFDLDAARDGVSRDQFESAIHEDDRDRIERKFEAAVSSCGEYEAEHRVWNAEDELRWVVARGRVECDEGGTPVTFPGALVDITERKRAEEELARQRQQLEALNNINEVARGITDAVIEQSTREEIERIVCERLAESESYSFAWIGDVHRQTRTVRLRTESGAEGYTDDLTISVEPDEPPSGCPAGRAVRTHEMQVTDDILGDESDERWREHARAYGFRSSAAIPIVHEDVLYGVLTVYADRPDAFGGDVGEVISHLGEVVGHAIAAIERKRALMSDEVVEVEFQVQNIRDVFDLPREGDGRLTFDRAVPAGDGAYLEYGTATDDVLDVLEGLVETLPHWESVRLLGGTPAEGATQFELRLVDPPVLQAVTALGGYIDRAIIEDGDYSVRIHLTPNVDPRRLIELVREAYPMARLVTRKQVTRTPDSPQQLSTVFDEHLTDRQRAALVAAYFAGYFEWPRDSKGKEVAASLGISAATYHQHLRSAQRKILQAALDEGATA